MTLRVIEYQIRGFRISWLITSLIDAQAHPYDDIVNLYHQRWNQETIHREWKHTLQLSNLRSRSPLGILKEVFVQLTLNNAIRAMQADALAFDDKPVTLQFLDTKRLVIAEIPAMAMAPIEQLPSIYTNLLRAIAMQKILVRPGRSYPRPNDGKVRNKGRGQLALPARLTHAIEVAPCSV